MENPRDIRTIRSTWDRIEAWLGRDAPVIFRSLRPGATEAQIGEAERTLGVTLPADVRESYRIHDGQVDAGLVDGYDLLPLSEVVRTWRRWTDLLEAGTFDGIRSHPDPGIVDDWWNPRWIPLTHNGAGDHHCLNLAPPPGGVVGQVFIMHHDWGGRPLLAPDFATWLGRFADRLEAHDYVVSENEKYLDIS